MYSYQITGTWTWKHSKSSFRNIVLVVLLQGNIYICFLGQGLGWSGNCSQFMSGCYYHFNNLRFRNSQNRWLLSCMVCISLDTCNEYVCFKWAHLKWRWLKWLLDHTMSNLYNLSGLGVRLVWKLLTTNPPYTKTQLTHIHITHHTHKHITHNT